MFDHARPLARALTVLCAAAAMLAGCTAHRASAANPNALWHIVHDLCVTDARTTGLPAPCTTVDLKRGYAVLKDIRGATQLLIIPTARVAGIESPELLAPGAPNYWQDALDSVPLFEKRVGRSVPRGEVGLAVNSVPGRTQNQLHIHLDCLRPDVRDALAANAGKIGPDWTRLDFDLAGRRYWARWIGGPTLGDRDPFKLLAERPEARADMSRETLVLAAMTFNGRPGFVLLEDQANWLTADKGAGEVLLDHQCRALAAPAAPAP